MVRCKECKWWTPMMMVSGNTGEELGPCKDAGKCTSGHLRLNGALPKDGLVCEVFGDAWIETGPDFGCVHGTRRRGDVGK